jgi:hypothetical protein
MQITRGAWVKPLSLMAALLALVAPAWAGSNVNPTQAEAWGANVGWLNWLPDPVNGVEISQFVCSGYIYSANLGWINVGSGAPANGIQYQNTSANDFGLNIDSAGNLRGLAYGANVGWINFEQDGAAHVDLTTGKLSGFAYGANIGWINLGDLSSANISGFGVTVDSISPGVDTDGDGIPDAWELLYAGNLTTFSATGDFDGDGATDLEEYLADTNPVDPTDFLHVLDLSVAPDGSSSKVTWSTKSTRQYLIQVRPSLDPTKPWQDSGLGLLAPDGSTTTRTLPGVPPQFLRIEALRPLVH